MKQKAKEFIEKKYPHIKGEDEDFYTVKISTCIDLMVDFAKSEQQSSAEIILAKGLSKMAERKLSGQSYTEEQVKKAIFDFYEYNKWADRAIHSDATNQIINKWWIGNKDKL